MGRQEFGRVRGILDKETMRIFEEQEAAARERDRILGLDRSTFAAKRSAEASGALTRALASNYLTARQEGRDAQSARLNVLNFLRSMIDPALQIGATNYEGQLAAREQTGGLQGLLGGAAGSSATGILLADKMGLSPWEAALMGLFSPGSIGPAIASNRG